MILVPGDAAGLSRSKLDKMGWWCSDTAHLRMDGVRVPARYLLGEEGGGFKIIMSNFNGERLGMSAMALGFAQACFDEALDWARQRKAFGSRAGGEAGDPPQAGGHADAHRVHAGLAGRGDGAGRRREIGI